MSEESSGSAGGQRGKMIGYRPRLDIVASMKEYRDGQTVKPDRQAVIDQALRMFFRANGITIAEKPADDPD